MALIDLQKLIYHKIPTNKETDTWLKNTFVSLFFLGLKSSALCDRRRWWRGAKTDRHIGP